MHSGIINKRNGQPPGQAAETNKCGVTIGASLVARMHPGTFT